MWRWSLICLKKSHFLKYFIFAFFFAIFFYSSLFANFPTTSFKGDLQSERIKAFTKLPYTFLVEGGKKSLKIDQCRNVVVFVRKGAIPVAGKKVFFSFSKSVNVHQKNDGHILSDRFKKETDSFGRIHFCFSAQEVGSLELLVFFLHPIHDYNQHLARLDFSVYNASKLRWYFFLSFIFIMAVAFLIVVHLLISYFFPHFAQLFLQIHPFKGNFFQKMTFIYGFVFRFVELRSLQVIFPLLWCRPYHLLRREKLCALSQKQIVDEKDPHFADRMHILSTIFHREILYHFSFMFVALSWIFLYIMQPWMAFLFLIFLFPFFRKDWFFPFYGFVFFNLFFSEILRHYSFSIDFLPEIMESSFFFWLLIVSFIFPFPLLSISFLLLLGQACFPVSLSFFSSMKDFNVFFVSARPLFIVILAEFLSLINIYLYCSRKIKD